MAMHPRRLASDWFLHEFERFGESKKCPCCRESYIGWGMFAHGFFKARVCDDCYANCISIRLKQKKEQLYLEQMYHYRLGQVKQLQLTGKFTTCTKEKK